MYLKETIGYKTQTNHFLLFCVKNREGLGEQEVWCAFHNVCIAWLAVTTFVGDVNLCILSQSKTTFCLTHRAKGWGRWGWGGDGSIREMPVCKQETKEISKRKYTVCFWGLKSWFARQLPWLSLMLWDILGSRFLVAHYCQIFLYSAVFVNYL